MALIVGTNRGEIIYGTTGVDKIYGMGGDDFIFGGANSEMVFGGPGNDILSSDNGEGFPLHPLAGYSGFYIGGSGSDQLHLGRGGTVDGVEYFDYGQPEEDNGVICPHNRVRPGNVTAESTGVRDYKDYITIHPSGPGDWHGDGVVINGLRPNDTIITQGDFSVDKEYIWDIDHDGRYELIAFRASFRAGEEDVRGKMLAFISPDEWDNPLYETDRHIGFRADLAHTIIEQNVAPPDEHILG